MEKWLCWGALGVAAVVLLLFVLDLIVGIPFQKLSIPINIIGIIASGLIIYLALDALRDLR